MASYKGACCHFAAHVEGWQLCEALRGGPRFLGVRVKLPAPASDTHLEVVSPAGPSAALVLSQPLELFSVWELAQCASPIQSLTPCGDLLTGSNWEVEADK